MEKKKRIDWLDVSKALGIYLVVLGHLVILNYKQFRFIFAFHMPLFFAVAGYVFASKEIPVFKKFIKSKFKEYVLPIIVIIVIGLLQCLLIPTKSCNAQSLFTANTIIEILKGRPMFSYFGASWFLFAMFFAQLMFYGYCKLYKKVSKPVFTLICLAHLAVSVYVIEIFDFIPVIHRLPLKIDSAMMGCVFMGVGALFAKINLDKYKKILKWILPPLGCIGVYFISCKWNLYVNMEECKYAFPLRYLAGAICGILMVFGLGMLFEKCVFLKYVGKNTLIIFLIHWLLIVIVINSVNRIWNTGYVEQYMKFDFVCVLISIIVFLLSLLCSIFYSHIKKKIIELIKNRKSVNS